MLYIYYILLKSFKNNILVVLLYIFIYLVTCPPVTADISAEEN